jgi:hypothetical protein
LKTLVKLLIAVAIINAATRGAMAAWTYYQFRDSAQELVIFGQNATPAELHDRVVAKGTELELPVGPENVTIRREGPRTWADAAYTQPVEFFPRYVYPVEFSFSVQGVNAVAAAK